jgi:mRNA-degrading endonuclease HigB of HigAB toxin-antitoxin module
MHKIKKYAQLSYWISVENKITATLKQHSLKIKSYYKKLTKRQRMLIFPIIGILLLLILSFSIFHTAKKSAPMNTHSITFQKPSMILNHQRNNSIKQIPIASFHPTNTREDNALTNQIKQLKSLSNKQIQALQSQLQAIKINLSTLASQGDMQQLQQALSQPNPALASKIDRLQKAIQKLAAQTTKKTWVDPKQIEHYFRLIAIQGFSDGMRAIIDVNGNQTTLSVNEICPACRGWVLKKMNFDQQQAVFYKKLPHQKLYVQLQAN